MYTQEELKSRYTGISSSSLDWFDEISPLYFKQRLDGTIKDLGSKETELGSQVHMYILELDKFNTVYLQSSLTKPKGDKQKDFCTLYITLKDKDGTLKSKDAALQAYKTTYTTDKKSEEKIKEEAESLYIQLRAYLKYLEEKDRYRGIISRSTLNYLENAKQAILNHPLANSLLYNQNENPFLSDDDIFIENELRLYWEYKNIVCKSIIDRLIINFKEKSITLVDIKTSSKLYEFETRLQTSHYKRQMAFYWKAIEYFFREKFKEYNFLEFSKDTYLVGIQTPNVYKELPVECVVAYISESTIQKEFDPLSQKLDEIIWHFENDLWNYRMHHYLHDGVDIVI
jgi:hypothetical protein